MSGHPLKKRAAMKNSLLYMRDDIQAFYAREDRKERVLYQVANVALLALACLGLGAVWMAFH